MENIIGYYCGESFRMEKLKSSRVFTTKYPDVDETIINYVRNENFSTGRYTFIKYFVILCKNMHANYIVIRI